MQNDVDCCTVIEQSLKIDFSVVKILREECCMGLCKVLRHQLKGFGRKVFEGLKEINVSYFEGKRENTLALFNDEEQILKINGWYYGLRANKELYKNFKPIVHLIFEIVVTHEIWHYYIWKYKLKSSKEWKRIEKFYDENKETILGFFQFIDSDAYPEDKRPEEFIVEGIARWDAGVISNKVTNKEYRDMIDFIEDIYNSFKHYIN